jgi:hypothetical protein
MKKKAIIEMKEEWFDSKNEGPLSNVITTRFVN